MQHQLGPSSAVFKYSLYFPLHCVVIASEGQSTGVSTRVRTTLYIETPHVNLGSMLHSKYAFAARVCTTVS